MIRVQDAIESLANHETDVDAFVRHSRERNILAVIELRKRQAELDFQAYVSKHIDADWQTRKQKLMRQFGADRDVRRTGISADTKPNPGRPNPIDQTKRADSNDMQRPVLSMQFNDVNAPGEDQDIWNAKAQTFAQAVNSLNEHRLMKQPVALCSLMSQLTRTLGSGNQSHQLADSWQILAFIADEKHIEHGRDTVGQLLQARHYFKQYCSMTGDNVALNRQILDRSRRYLETQFFALVEREIARNPHEARLGGTPSPETKIKAFVNVRFSKNGKWTMSNLELINNAPMWAVIFYLVRAGFLTEAAQYSLKNESSLSKVEKNWCAYISAFASSPIRKLPRQLADRLHTDFNQRIKFVSESTDPFKHALYKILGRCDLSRKTLPEVLPVAEDWMWLQLSLATEAETESAAYEGYNLSDLQQNLVRFSAKHFNPRGTNPLLYFQILLLSGQFERAIHYLASQNWTDAIHFAIILSYYGLLRVFSNESSSCSLIDNENLFPRLNFAGLLQMYSRQLQKYSSYAAVEYLSLICLNSDLPQIGTQQRALCHTSLRSLVLESRDFAALLGDIRTDGSREAGFIEQRLALLELQDEKQYLRTIAEHAAASSDQDGRVADAILLYHLAEEYDTVVEIINRSLGEALLNPAYSALESKDQSGSLTRSDDPSVLAQNMLHLYTSNASIFSVVSQNNKDDCGILLSMVNCKKQYNLGKHDECLSIINGIGIIPVADNTSIGFVKGRAQAFSLLNDCVARNIPNLLLLAASSLRIRYDQISRNTYQEQTRQAQMASIKRRARNVSTFVGLIKYQMSEDVRLALEETLIAIR